MNVYVCYTEEDYEGCSHPLAVCSTLELAKAEFRESSKEWKDDGDGGATRLDRYSCAVIARFEVA